MSDAVEMLVAASDNAVANATRIAECMLKKLTTKEKNNLPDSAFAIVLPGGKKDKSGKTEPRSLRKFPIHDAEHVRNALARLPKSNLTPAQKASALKKIKAAAKKFDVKVKQHDVGRSPMATEDQVPKPENDNGDAAAANAGADQTTGAAVAGVEVHASEPATPTIVSINYSNTPTGAEDTADSDKATAAPDSPGNIKLNGQVEAMTVELNDLKAQLAIERKARHEAELARIVKEIEPFATKEQVGLLNGQGLALMATLSGKTSVLEFATSLIVAGGRKKEELVLEPGESETDHGMKEIASGIEARLSGFTAAAKLRGVKGNELKQLVEQKRAELISPDA